LCRRDSVHFFLYWLASETLKPFLAPIPLDRLAETIFDRGLNLIAEIVSGRFGRATPRAGGDFSRFVDVQIERAAFDL
jgi:hypothetical protein